MYGSEEMGRPRLSTKGREHEFSIRFASVLYDLMACRGWSAGRLAKLITEAGLKVNERAVYAWLRGERLPRLKDIETVGNALGFHDDYRLLLPAPLKRAGRKSR